ncbi:MAG: hypothetical protein ACPGLV_15390 [Bacteroidia bacterium]
MIINGLYKAICLFHSIQDDSSGALKGDEILHIDGGPHYTESNFNDLLPEPFNMISAAIFMFIALYWFVKSSRQATSFRFLKLSSVILAIGGLGGTIYHGFRVWEWAMWMDWVPILVLCIAAAAYFIYRIYKNVLLSILALVVAVGLQFVNFYTIPDWLNTSTSYGILAAFILVPLIMALSKTKFLYWYYPTIALIAFGLALTFRIGDREQWLYPVGTHFLWHTFGAIACHAMFKYLFLFKRAFPRFELINKMRLKNIRLANFKKAREIILRRWNKNSKGTS